MRTAIFVAMVVGLLCPAALAQRSSLAGWLPAEKLDDTLKLAATKDVPLVIMHQIKNSTCPLHNGKVSAWHTNRDLKAVLKVDAFTDATPPIITQLRRKLKLRFVPYLVFTDGEGRLIAYVPYEADGKDLARMAGQAKSVMAWKKAGKATLGKLDKQIKNRQLAPAWSALEKLEKEDRMLTAVVDFEIQKLSEKSYPPPRDATAAEKKPSKPKPAERGEFFQDGVDSKRAALQQAIDDEFAKVEAVLAGGDTQGALRALRPVLAIKDDGIKEKCAELRTRIVSATKKARTTDTAPSDEADPKPAGSGG